MSSNVGDPTPCETYARNALIPVSTSAQDLAPNRASLYVAPSNHRTAVPPHDNRKVLHRSKRTNYAMRMRAVFTRMYASCRVRMIRLWWLPGRPRFGITRTMAAQRCYNSIVCAQPRDLVSYVFHNSAWNRTVPSCSTSQKVHPATHCPVSTLSHLI